MNGANPPRIPGGLRALLLGALAVPLLAGCASLVSRAGASLGRDLGAGVLNQDDPQTVADGLPAYLLLVDGLLTSSPDDADLLLTGATLNGATRDRSRRNPNGASASR
jgi:hypothetical protein